MNSSNQIRSFPNVSLIFFAPLDPFMILIALFHCFTFKQSITSARNATSEKVQYYLKILRDCCATFDRPPAPSRLLQFPIRIFMLLGLIPSIAEAFASEM